MARESTLVRAVGRVGERTTGLVDGFGRFCLFSAMAMFYAPSVLATWRGWRRLLQQAYLIGTLSVPVVALTGAFVGMVLITQGWPQFDATGFADRLGGIVNISVASELGPVLAGVMLAGRVGGALAAELGTMNVTEQLLALRSMGTDPIRYLVAPRFLACLLLTPLLTAYADVMGALGAWLVYSGVYGGESEAYWNNTLEVVLLWDIGMGLMKALFFGGIIGLISCYKGFHCRPGAEGVGRACTDAFVASFMVILALDFFLDIVINRLFDLVHGPRSLL